MQGFTLVCVKVLPDLVCARVCFRSESTSASQEGVKCSVSRELSSVAVYESAPSEQPGTPPLHHDAYTTHGSLEEGGMCDALRRIDRGFGDFMVLK